MKVFLFTVQLPSHVWEERKITGVAEVGEHLLYWTTKELNEFFSGEFEWTIWKRKFGLCAIQYINRTLVRIIINANDQPLARSLVKSIAWHLDPKKFHKRHYTPRQSKNSTNSYASR